MKERVVITGANGHIGRRLVAAVQAAGFEVVALVRDESSARQWAAPGVTARRWALKETTAQHLEGAVAVCHLAAFVPPNLADAAFAQRCVEDNALGSLRVTEAARAAGVGEIVYASAGQIYGNLERPASEADAIDLGPRAPFYLGSKLLGEIYCRQAESAMRVVALRIGAVYGPGMGLRATVRRLIDDARNGRPIRLSGGGVYGADFVFVDDVVAAILASLRRPVSGIYNIGSGVRTTIADLATMITERLGGTIEMLGDAPGSPGFAALDIQKARRELGYAPTSLSDGLARMVDA